VNGFVSNKRLAQDDIPCHRYHSQAYIRLKTTSPQATLFYDLFFSHSKQIVTRNKYLQIKWERQISPEALSSEMYASPKRIPVVFILVESLRSDVLKDNSVMPNMYGLIKESLYYPNSFTTSSHSDYADVALLSSHYPLRSNSHHYYPSNIPYPRILIYDVLKKIGFKTAIISAQNEDWGNMRNYLETDNVDVFFDSTSSTDSLYVSKEDTGFAQWAQKRQAGKLDDAIVINKAIDWISTLEREDFFVYINLQRSHFPYTWPKDFTPSFAPYTIDFSLSFGKYPISEVGIMKNRYYNSLSYVDYQIGRLIRYLKDNQLFDQSIFVVTGDTGQAFYEHGYGGHAGALHNEVAVVPTIIKTPQSRHRGLLESFIQHIDIPPTICRLLHIDIHPSFQGINIFNEMLLKKKPIFMTAQTSIANQDVVVFDGWKLIRDYRTDKESLYDLTVDIDEKNNLILESEKEKRILGQVISGWRSTQLEYYSNEDQYKKYYPPQYFIIQSLR